MKRKNIIFVVDSPDWAFGTIAKNVAEGIRKDYNVDILYTQDIKSYHDFISVISRLKYKPDLIHFFWRDYLNEVISYLKQHSKHLSGLFSNCALTTHVPDHLYTQLSNEIEARIELFNVVDNYFVTSSKIKDVYNQLPFYPAPHSVIYDNPELPTASSHSKLRLDKEAPCIAWIGNSKWGEHLGYKDYKGLKNVIKPALDRLKNNGYSFSVKIFDKADKSTPRDEILNELENVDILLISSIEEGTPLPFIEGISRGCAVISTDVGIVNEILNKEQLDYIVPRSSDSFYEALLSLITDAEKLERVKKNNLDVYKEKFLNTEETAGKWKLFIEDSIENSRSNFRKSLFEKKISTSKKIKNQLVSRSYSLGKRLDLIDTLKRSEFIRKHYQKSLVSDEYVEYEIFKKRYENEINEKEYVTFYSPRWHGVANSTKTIFSESAIAFPLFSKEYPEVTEHQFLDSLVEICQKNKKLKAIIVSGGVELHRVLVKKLKEKRKDIKVYLAWHGSPAQWVDIFHYQTFIKWADLAKTNELDGIISFKPDLNRTIERMGLPSLSIRNPIPTLNLPKEKKDNRIINIGVFAALFSWYKNPFVQIISTIGIKNSRVYTNLNIEAEFSLIAKKLDLKIVDASMSNEKFVSLLNEMDMILYVTNTECSPMIALESCAVGTPCIVGPAGNIYKGNKFLEKYLVVNEVDNPTAINAKINEVIENYDSILSEIKVFSEEYNLSVFEEKEKLIKEVLR